MKRMLVNVKTITEYKLTVDIPDGTKVRDVRSWFQENDFDPRDRNLDENVVDTIVTVVPIERDLQDPTYMFDPEQGLHGEEEHDEEYES